MANLILKKIFQIMSLFSHFVSFVIIITNFFVIFITKELLSHAFRTTLPPDRPFDSTFFDLGGRQGDKRHLTAEMFEIAGCCNILWTDLCAQRFVHERCKWSGRAEKKMQNHDKRRHIFRFSRRHKSRFLLFAPSIDAWGVNDTTHFGNIHEGDPAIIPIRFHIQFLCGLDENIKGFCTVWSIYI